MKLNELKKKVIVNIKDGTVIGKISDVEVDPNDFVITSLCVKKNSFFIDAILNIFIDKSVIINVNSIEKIGKHVILVNQNHSGK